MRALVRRTLLGVTSGGRTVRVGRFLRASVGGRRVAFAVSLNSAAKRVLARSGRLAVTVQITVTPRSGAVYSATRAVTLRRTASG